MGLRSRSSLATKGIVPHPGGCVAMERKTGNFPRPVGWSRHMPGIRAKNPVLSSNAVGGPPCRASETQKDPIVGQAEQQATGATVTRDRLRGVLRERVHVSEQSFQAGLDADARGAGRLVDEAYGLGALLGGETGG